VWPTSNSGNIFNFNNNYYWPGPPNCAQRGGYAALLWDPIMGTTFLDANSVSFGQPVPEPGTLALLGTSVLGLAGILRRRIF
jgi:hypothetical protein